MSALIPPARPKLSRAEAERLLAPHRAQLRPGDKVVVLAVRGYYLNSMGAPGVNDRGLYDDAVFIITPDYFTAWNANTDPSVWRKGIATLAPGVHRYRRGNHGLSRPGGGYPAFRPATPGEALPVTRDGVPQPKPGVAINIHRGGRTTTSSEGCQTIHPAQWPAFYAVMDAHLKRHAQTSFPYVLTIAQP